MKRILLVLVLVFVSGSFALGEVPQGVQIDFEQLVNFDDLFDELGQWFTDVLKEWWVVILSLFVCWLGVGYAIGVLEGKIGRNRVLSEVRERVFRESIVKEERERLAARQRSVERSREAIALESEYRSRELQNIVLRDREKLVLRSDGAYYIGSESYGVISYQTLEQWRANRESEQSEPLAFDNEDYGRVYDSIVDRDYQGRVSDEYKEISLSQHADVVPGELTLAEEPLAFDNKDYVRFYDSIVDRDRLRHVADSYEEVAELELETEERRWRNVVDKISLSVAHDHGFRDWKALLYDRLDKDGALSYGFEDWDDFDREQLVRAREERVVSENRYPTYW
jgi:ribosomal protein S21